MPNIIFTESAFREYLDWQQQDRRALRRINALLRDAARDPFGGIGKPEALRGNLSGCWSRRIDEVNRLVYRVSEAGIEVYQCKGHYQDA